MMKVGNLVLNVFREQSAQTDKLTAALCKAWSDFGVVELDRTGVRNGERFRYASINSINRAIMPALVKHGLFPVTQFACGDHSFESLTLKHAPSDQWVSSTVEIPRSADMQADHAWKTTLRKEMIEGLLNLVMEEGEDSESVALPTEAAAGAAPAVNAAAEARATANLESAVGKMRRAKDRSEAETLLAKAEGYVERGLMPSHASDDLQQIMDEKFPKEVVNA